MNLSYEEYQKMFNPTKVDEVLHNPLMILYAQHITQSSHIPENNEYESDSSFSSSDIEIVEKNCPNDKVMNKYDSKKYIQTFLLKNSDKIKEKITCNICCGSYTYFNKSKHIRSKKHLLLVEKYGR